MVEMMMKDPCDYNQAVKRHHYPSRTIEEIVARIPNAKVFSVLDTSNGFLQIPLDDAFAYTTTFNTPYGRYHFLRIPFGIASAAEVFQKAMDQLFASHPCECIVDVIVIWVQTTLRSRTPTISAKLRT